jgi:hypothetical protein
MRAAARTQASEADHSVEPSRSWVLFFQESARLAALAHSRREAAGNDCMKKIAPGVQKKCAPRTGIRRRATNSTNEQV